MKLEDLIIESNGARREIPEDITLGSEYRWQHKTVKESKVLFNGDTLDDVSLVGRGTLSLSSKFSTQNKFCLCVTTNTDIENVTPRPSTVLHFNLKGQDLSGYNRMSTMIYIEATGYQNFYFHFLFGNNGFKTNHAPSIYPNKWTYVTWEVDHIKRDNVAEIEITPFLMGCPPEALPIINIYIANIKAEVVDKDFDEGWNLDERIAYCHSGYMPVSRKIALTGKCDDEYFTITNIESQKVYKYKVKEKETNLGKFYVLEFTNVTETGTYVLEVDGRKTMPFLIDFTCFDSSIWKSLNFLRSLRCGEEVEGVHSACHLNCKTVHPDGRMVPNFGGWHDAGDVSQFEIPTAEIANALTDLATTLKANRFLYTRILEEAKVGLTWLLRTRFGDGYRAMAVTYNIWRKNVVEPTNYSILNKAEAGSFENFLSASALASGAKVFKEHDEIFANWCLRSASEDFKFAVEEYEKKIYTIRWGEPIESQTAGAAVLAACELFTATNNDYYLEKAKEFASIVMNCQEKGTDAPMKGFFYEDQEHKYILCYEHRGHEQSPIQGLVKLYQLLPVCDFRDTIKKSLDLYRTYVLDSVKYGKPYLFLPGHIYNVNKINISHFTIPPKVSGEATTNMLLDQIKSGIDLGDGWYLRLMPISVSRRGFHATLLSKTKAVSLLSKVLKDNDLRAISIAQIEWILGKNPFGVSTMYGEGYNYHPLYVAFSRQIVGSLPVGIKTKDSADIPYWPTINNAVYKEIWGHTTAKYLWVMADVL